ncbi:MAG: NAD(+) diphosphatase [Pseudomonadota bacterium]|nr:NAD(+) diphosphatase [Pseudomonadota bacterium]
MANRFYYDAISLDRAPHLRHHPKWSAGSPQSGDARVLPIWRDKNMVRAGDTPTAVFLNGADGAAVIEAASTVVFLGLEDGTSYYAADLSKHDDPTMLPLPEGTEFEDLRRLATNIDPAEAGYLAYARALGHWHHNHEFCGACGAETIAAKGGHERNCSNEECGRSHFPRTDPAVIMLVTHPTEDKCLMGHNKRFKGLRYSTLAGFVEPGETLEQAVAREVKEEAGVQVDNVRYMASQPWPFPATIMLGFRARAYTTEINCEDDELLEARWFTRVEVREMGETGMVLPPSQFSISRWLIDTWLDEEV